LFNAALRGETCWRRHEFRSDRIADAIGEDAVDLHQRIAVQLPAHDLGDRIKLIGMSGAPGRDTQRLLIEHPAHRQMEDALAVLFTRERIELLDRMKILLQARGLELGIGTSQIVAVEATLAQSPGAVAGLTRSCQAQ
jgi:hypothetical protein